MFDRTKNPNNEQDEVVQGIKEDISELKESIEKEAIEMKAKLISDGRDPESADKIVQEVKRRATVKIINEYKRQFKEELKQVMEGKEAANSASSSCKKSL